MTNRTRTTAGVAGLGLIAFFAVVSTIGCEDTAITAPEGSTITLTASPATVEIDQVAGATEGTTTITAQLLDMNGIPQSEIPLQFTSTGGRLNSVSNFCRQSGTCSRSGDACSGANPCPELPPVAIETDINGIATDTLTLRLVDPDSVDVVARSTTSESTVTVPKNVIVGTIDPRAVITAAPDDRARTGQPVLFDASESTLNPDMQPLTCYRWSIESSLDPGNPEITFSTRPTLSKVYGTSFTRTGEQDLTVELNISDRVGTCDDTLRFSPFVDSISYIIRCDFQPITVNPGPDQTKSLSNQDPASFSLVASAFDPEDPDLTFEWSCPNAIAPPDPPMGEAATCQYDTTGTFTANVTVTNQCGRIASGSVQLQVNP